MNFINANNLHRKSGVWGTRHWLGITALTGTQSCCAMKVASKPSMPALA